MISEKTYFVITKVVFSENFNDSKGPNFLKMGSHTVNSSIKACLVFNFWTFGAVLYLNFCQFLLNKSPNFYNFFSLLLKSLRYLKFTNLRVCFFAKALFGVKSIQLIKKSRLIRAMIVTIHLKIYVICTYTSMKIITQHLMIINAINVTKFVKNWEI